MREDALLAIVVTGLVLLGVAFLAGNISANDTYDGELLRCISTCQDEIESYKHTECVCKSGLRLEG